MQRNHYSPPRQAQAARAAAIFAILDAVRRDDQRANVFGRPRGSAPC